jgi:hypothetical protein
MPANEVSTESTTFSPRNVRTNDFKPAVTKNRDLVVRLGGVLLILGGLATAAIARGHGPLLRWSYLTGGFIRPPAMP